jgi:hypothetical protein
VTLDEKIRSTLEGTASTVAYVPATSPDEIKRRGRRRRARRRVAWTVPAVILVLGVLAVTIPFDPNPRSPATSQDVDIVEIADLAVAVTNSEPVSTDPDVWLGLKGPTPSFDTSALGPNLSFTPGQPAVGDLEDRINRAVYLGELQGVPFYIYSTNAPSVWDQIFEVIGGNFSGDVLGTSLNCCSGGDMDHAEGLPGFSHSISSEDGLVTNEVITAEWLGLSTNVSVVAYRLDGVFIGWQTPVGGVSSLSVAQRPSEYLAVAFDASGRELDRFGTQLEPLTDFASPTEIESPGDSRPSGADWAPMTSEGSEIEPDEIPTEELRDAISPQPGDRFFLVPIEDGEIVVVVRGGLPHVYAALCAVFDGVDLPPGWEQTCLD